MAWVQAARPKTLVAAFIPVAIGSSIAVDLGSFRAAPALLCLVFAFLVQVGTNFANDYFDFKKGADKDRRFGPPRAVASGTINPRTMLLATIAVLALAFVAGLCLLPYGGKLLLVVGIASLVCAIAYTGGPFPLAYLGLGDIFVVLFFGLVSVGFTQYVQTGTFPPEGWVAGLAIGLAINNLLVVNNYRDVEEDSQNGKRTLAVRLGRKFSLWQYALQGTGAAVCLLFLYQPPGLPWAAVSMALGFFVTRSTFVLGKAVSRESFLACLGTAAKQVVLLGILLCVRILTA
jgi:1,4-dihydroxy-2-naphthoate octaprenyltransferase